MSMATSIYVYENIEEYKKVYGDKMDSAYFHTKIIDMYIANKDKLWVVTELVKEVARPQLNRTIVHFIANEVEKYLTGDEKLILYEKISFNQKKDRIEIFPKMLRSPELFFRIGRYYGNEQNKSKTIDYSQRFYDFTTNRINLILK